MLRLGVEWLRVSSFRFPLDQRRPTTGPRNNFAQFKSCRSQSAATFYWYNKAWSGYGTESSVETDSKRRLFCVQRTSWFLDENRKIGDGYLFFVTVHLLKNIRNNLEAISNWIKHWSSSTSTYWLPFFLFAPTQNSQDLEKSAFSRDPKTSKARGGPKELSTDISVLCPLQDPWEAYLRPRWTVNQSTGP